MTSRIRFTSKQKAELWERWRNGQSAAAISRALERRNKTGVQAIVALHGGIAPGPRRRAVAALRLEEREGISRGIAVCQSLIIAAPRAACDDGCFIPAGPPPGTAPTFRQMGRPPCPSDVLPSEALTAVLADMPLPQAYTPLIKLR